MDESSNNSITTSSLMTTRPIAAATQPAAAQQQSSQPSQLVERRTRPLKEQALHCPRCNSTNTKFCYYNNYSLTQPRYFCKTCRRYWTEGGSLRNVPVGGGSRKNKRHSSSSSISASAPAKITNMTNLQPPPPPLPAAAMAKPYQGQDLNLAFTNTAVGFTDLISGGGFPAELSAMELLRSTGLTAHMSMAPDTSAVYSAAGFSLHDFGAQSAGFAKTGNVMNEGGRLLFPFGDLKQVSVKSGNENHEQNRDEGGDHHPPMFWGGVNLGAGGGGSW